MASIQAGTYTFQEVLDRAGFNLQEKAAADYLDGAVDHRRVKVGGLGFDSPDEAFNIPVTADAVEITLDGKKVASLSINLDEEQKKARTYSFETAAEASEGKTS